MDGFMEIGGVFLRRMYTLLCAGQLFLHIIAALCLGQRSANNGISLVALCLPLRAGNLCPVNMVCGGPAQVRSHVPCCNRHSRLLSYCAALLQGVDLPAPNIVFKLLRDFNSRQDYEAKVAKQTQLQRSLVQRSTAASSADAELGWSSTHGTAALSTSLQRHVICLNTN